VIPEKVAGDYFNNNVILLKYELDLADPDNIKNRFSIGVYPTFVFVDGNGEEFTRFSGFGGGAEGFIERVQNAIRPENSWAVKNAKLWPNPEYVLEHIKALQNAYMNDRARDLFTVFFASRSIQENFSGEDNLKLINEMTTSTDSPVVMFMLNRSGDVAKVMGEKEFKNFLTSKSHLQIQSKLRDFDIGKPETVEVVVNELKKMNDNPWFSTNYTRFFADNIDNIKEKNLDAIFENTKKALSRDLSAVERSAILSFYSGAARMAQVEVDRETSRERSITIYEIAIAAEKDPKALESLESALERIKNPQRRPAGGTAAIPLR